MKHAFLTTATAALMALGSYAAAQDLKMSHVRPQDATIDLELRAFSAAVDEATGGDVKINIFPASALGDYTTVQERISVGAIDMATQPAAAAADRRRRRPSGVRCRCRGSTEPGVTRTSPTSAAAAERRIVPALPGSETPSRRTQSGASSARASDGKKIRDRQNTNATRQRATNTPTRRASERQVRDIFEFRITLANRLQ